DVSAGDANYGAIGQRYAAFRRPDPRIAALIETALGDAQTVLNVGAGAGSYEPIGRAVTAVEPSASMRAQRPSHLPRAIGAAGDPLPLGAGCSAARLSFSPFPQGKPFPGGLNKMRRGPRGPVLIMPCDPAELDRFWLQHYCPEVIAVEAKRYPPPRELA